MAFVSLRTVSFRNLVDSETDIKGKDIFLIGQNGQGKTNFLEALYYCSYASSFRGVRDNEMVRLGEKDFSVTMRLDGELNSEVSVYFKDGKKNITLDSKRVEDRKDLLAVNPCIVFCHEDMEFVSGAPERRRWFFDQTQSLWDPVYLDDLRNYRKVLKNRNLILKNEHGKKNAETNAVLDALDPQLVFYGIELMKKREAAAKDFSFIFEPLYREISGIDNVTMRYAPSWKEQDASIISTELSGRRDAELSMGLSLSGPHRDRFIFTQKGKEFTGKASTGQRRLLALLLRIAQAGIFSGKTGKNPVLLLDDVLLELDGEKRRKFLSLMPKYDQAFFTFLAEEPYERYRKEDTIMYKVHAGSLKWEK